MTRRGTNQGQRDPACEGYQKVDMRVKFTYISISAANNFANTDRGAKKCMAWSACGVLTHFFLEENSDQVCTHKKRTG